MKNIGCLHYSLHTRPNLSYWVGVLSRYMQNPKESHGAAMKQCLRYLQGTTTFGLTYEYESSTSKATRLVGYNDSSHNVGLYNCKITTSHILYFGKYPISWQKEYTVALFCVTPSSWRVLKQQENRFGAKIYLLRSLEHLVRRLSFR